MCNGGNFLLKPDNGGLTNGTICGYNAVEGIYETIMEKEGEDKIWSTGSISENVTL